MPSGSKRRKAAKKKKEKEAPISGSSSAHTYNSNAHENDEVRIHDEKDSDGGEPDSPASHDEHGPFNGGTENKPVDIHVHSGTSQKSEVEGDGGAETAEELKFEDDPPIPIERVEPVKEQQDEGNEISSIIWSDGESLVTEEEKCVDEEGIKNLETTKFEDLEKPGESLPQELTMIDGGPGEDVNVAELTVSLSEKVIDSTEAALSENRADFGLSSRGKEDLLTSIDAVQQVASNWLESASSNVGARTIPMSVENSGVESGAVTSVSKEKDGEFLPSSDVSVTQTHNGTEKVKDFQVCESNDELESASNDTGANLFPMSVGNSGVKFGAVTSVLEEKEGNLLPTPGVSVAHTHNGMEKAEDFEVCEPNNGFESASNNVEAKVFPVSVENTVIESCAVISVSKGKEGELLPSPGVSDVQTQNGTEKATDFVVCEPNNGLDSASNNVNAKVFPVSIESSVSESGDVTFVSKEKDGELLPSSGVSVAQTHNCTERAKDFAACEPNNGLESASNNVGAKVFPVSVENSVVESGAVTSVLREKEGELLPSAGVPVAQTCVGTEKAKDVEPLVTPAPRIVEKTSWMSCCGILDIFMGSSR